MTDAAHLLSDCISFIVALVAICLSKKSPDNYMTFGYKRAGKFERTKKNKFLFLKFKPKYYFFFHLFALFHFMLSFGQCRGFGSNFINIWYMAADNVFILLRIKSFIVSRFRNQC